MALFFTALIIFLMGAAGFLLSLCVAYVVYKLTKSIKNVGVGVFFNLVMIGVVYLGGKGLYTAVKYSWAMIVA